MRKSSLVFLVGIGLMFSVGAMAAEDGKIVPVRYHSGFRFLDQSVNRIEGDLSTLQSFYAKLYRLRGGVVGGRMQVSIFHLGDSHLQAGFLGGTIMHSFQRDFGNAGRGLITPLKLAKTNEPFDYDIFSSNPWTSSRCVATKPRFLTGIGGIALRTGTDPYDLRILCKTQAGFNYTFNKVRIFHSPNPQEIFHIQAQDNKVIAYQRTRPFLTELTLSGHNNQLTLLGKGFNPTSGSIYGFSLENGKSGVLYHAVGLNGAQFFHYKRIENFGNQIHALNPQLIILSLGTNEAFRGNVTEQQLMREIESLVGPIKKQNPQAAILMTTPAECQQKVPVNGIVQYVPNHNMRIIRNAIVKYALQNHYPYWDLYRISGGDGSSENWVESKMLARDRVHFEVAGYRVQGNLFYQALMGGYNAYVVNRTK